MQQDLLSLISGKTPEFSKGQKRIAEYILAHYDRASFMTASKLGATVGVSESTVVRFASILGFDGYPGLQKALHELIRNKLTAVQRIEVTSEQLGSGDVLEKVLNLDIERIRRTLEETSQQEFDQAVDAILSAKTIYIIGARSASALARFTSYYFGLIFENVKLVHTTSTSEMFEQIMRMGPQDVLMGISFPRYSQTTAKAFDFAKEHGAKVIAVTDSQVSPIAQAADIKLLARSDMLSFVDSLVAPLSLLNALIVAVGLRKREEISQTFEQLETIWEKYHVYAQSGDDEKELPE